MGSELMATNAGVAKLEPVGTAILEQLADLDAEGISPKTARKFLTLGFGASRQRRVTTLSEKAQEGSLSLSEREELDEYIRVGDLLAILHSKARQALKQAGLKP